LQPPCGWTAKLPKRGEPSPACLVSPPPLRRGVAIALARGLFDFAAAISDPESADAVIVRLVLRPAPHLQQQSPSRPVTPPRVISSPLKAGRRSKKRRRHNRKCACHRPHAHKSSAAIDLCWRTFSHSVKKPRHALLTAWSVRGFPPRGTWAFSAKCRCVAPVLTVGAFFK